MGKVFPFCMCVRAYAWLCSITQSAGVSWWNHQSARQPLLVPDWLNYSPYVTLATLMSPGAPVSAEAWAKQSRSRYNHSTHATPHPSPGLIELITAALFTRRHTGQSIQPHGPQPAPTSACIYSAKGGQTLHRPDSYSCSARRMLMPDGANYSVRGR